MPQYCLPLSLTVVLSVVPAHAADLLQIYRDALANDATYASARAARDAGLESLPQGLAQILPTVNATAFTQYNDIAIAFRGATPEQYQYRLGNSNGYTVTLTQPLFNWQNIQVYKEAGFKAVQAEATFGQATQDLIVRVSQAYFDVLSAQDTLGLVRAQKAAIFEQLAQAKRNFEVGTATITDTHEAQARFDLIVAQEIAAQNDLENKRRALQALNGKEYAELAPLRADVRLPPPSPSNMQDWVDLAQKQSYPVALQEATTEVTRLEAKRSFAAHLPTLDFIATYGKTGQSATITSPVGSDVTTTQIGLQFALPLYQGGAISSREREAAALYLKAKDDLENARRQAALSAQQTYLSVINGIAQVGALEQALVSSQSALDSNKLGYEVGVRINIDVLNAQQQLFSTRRDLSAARYN